MAQFGFNAADVPDGPDMGQIPPADYPLQIVDSGLDRKDNGTEQIKLVYKVVGGQFDGRQISQWYTVKCANQQAVDIGLRQLRSVCEAVGVAGFRDTCELHGRNLLGRVGTKKNNDGKEYADLKSVKPFSPTGATKPATAPAAATAAAPAASTTAPAAAPASASAPARAPKPWER